MSEPVKPHAFVRAFDDPASRRAAARYGIRALGLTLVSVPLVGAAVPFISEDGNTKEGVPELLLVVLFAGATLAVLGGGLSLLNLLRIIWVLRRWPWRVVGADFEEVMATTPNGQPALTVQSPEGQQTLTLAALKWRWGRFQQPQLLLAARPGRGGVVATSDRQNIAWAGRSLATRFLLWLRTRRQQR